MFKAKDSGHLSVQRLSNVTRRALEALDRCVRESERQLSYFPRQGDVAHFATFELFGDTACYRLSNFERRCVHVQHL